jgi:hypothetical protein
VVAGAGFKPAPTNIHPLRMPACRGCRRARI